MGGYSTGKAFSFIKAVIGETRRRSVIMSYQRAALSTESFKRKILTLRMSLPRRMGNTTLAVKLFKHYKNSLLVIPSMSYLKSMTYGVFDRTRVVTPQMQLDCLGAVPVVIVDVATWMKPEQIEKIYGIMSDFYVLLG